MLAKVITGHGCVSVTGYKLSLVTFLELTFWNSYVVVHVDHISITCDRCTFWSHFDYRRCVEFSHARPSESCSLLLADLRGVWVLPSSCVGAVCFLTRGRRSLPSRGQGITLIRQISLCDKPPWSTELFNLLRDGVFFWVLFWGKVVTAPRAFTEKWNIALEFGADGWRSRGEKGGDE